MQTSIKHVPKRCTWIVGIDEAGRGPVAGPLSIGVTMIRRKDIDTIAELMPKLRDSKKLSPSKRNEILEQARTLEVEGRLYARTVLTSNKVVDDKGISHTIYSSICEGLDELMQFTGVQPKNVFVQLDGSLHAPSLYRQQTTIKGDEKIFAIALASIYAKTVRDGVMEQYDIQYPKYGFYNHKGYGTVEHMKNIKKHGLSPIHRKTFLKKYLTK